MFRFPRSQHDPSLQAWDSADEYVCQHLLEQPQWDSRLLILNDQFGALSVGLNQFEPKVVTDSFISRQAIIQNCEDNHLPVPGILSSLEPLPDADTVVLRLTKNIGFLAFQLWQISQMPTPCHIIASGKTTLVTSNTLKLFEKYLANVKTSLARKKSRLIFAEHSGTKANNSDLPAPYPVSTPWPEMQLNLQAHANVFSKEQIDIGGRFLAEHLPPITAEQTVVDLGCGNGLLGLAVLKQLQSSEQSAKLIFCDESEMAVASAQLNVNQQFPECLANCQFNQDDCLTSQAPQSVDIILCNPPFHQQNTITEHIARQMFNDAKVKLKVDGMLYVVANRHLPYGKNLKKLFGGFNVYQQNNKFIIYACQKREKQ